LETLDEFDKALLSAIDERARKRLCAKLGIKPQESSPVPFSTFIRKLKEHYCTREHENAVWVIQTTAKPKKRQTLLAGSIVPRKAEPHA
jgi:hypothetical protein